MIIIVMLIGAGLVYLFLQKLYAKLWNKDLQMDINFSSSHSVVGDKVELTEVIVNKKWLPLPYINVKFQLNKELIFEDDGENSQISDKTYRNDIFSLMMFQKITRRVPVYCSKRGVYSINKMEVVSTGIFMNEVMVVNKPVNTELTVYPIAADARQSEFAFSKILGMIELNRNINEDVFAFRGIRGYTPQDPMNKINWKASARAGSFLVNQYNETVCQEVCILLNLESETMLLKEELSETSISIAAGVAQMLIEKGIEVSLVSNGCDVQSKESVKLESASGIAHINTINTALARINLSLKMTDFISFLNILKQKEGPEEKNKLYIMISQNRRKDLQCAFNEFAADKNDCIWITPHYKDEYQSLDYSNAQHIDWEAG